jgi:ribosomal subunit interface protein
MSKPDNDQSSGTLHVAITGKRMAVSDSFRDRVESRLASAVTKYFADAIDANVTIFKEGGHICSDCSVHVGHGIYIKSRGQGGDAYAAFEDAAEHVEKQLRRYKRRLRNHHNKRRNSAAPARAALSYVLSDDADEQDLAEADELHPVVIAENTTEIPTCTTGEAVMRMDLADQPVMMFHNSAHGRINLVYRRSDGNIGWIDPKEGSA